MLCQFQAYIVLQFSSASNEQMLKRRPSGKKYASDNGPQSDGLRICYSNSIHNASQAACSRECDICKQKRKGIRTLFRIYQKFIYRPVTEEGSMMANIGLLLIPQFRVGRSVRSEGDKFVLNGFH